MNNLRTRIPELKNELQRELLSIADWWVANTIDHDNGGFYGEVDVENRPVKNSGKGIILNTRILWFFSEAAQELDIPVYRECAQRAYDYLIKYFFDEKYGGVFWELSAYGEPITTKKQTYAQAFTIYALCSYYQLTRNQQALLRALSCFELLETRTIDHRKDGYIEAFSRDWSAIADWRLSELDLNYPKSQNTHLHVLEAYTSLHSVHPTPQTRAALRYSIEMFDKHMINRDNHHLRMFMDMDWNDFSPGYTYGHDIEASWLIAKALESLADKDYIEQLTPTLIKVAEVTLNEAIGERGELLNSYNYLSRTVDTSAMWWVQAEALVGFLYAYGVTNDQRYFAAAEAMWHFIKQHQIDSERGEWFWLADNAQTAGKEHYKVGFWKCPYHNGRAMMEATRYLDELK